MAKRVSRTTRPALDDAVAEMMPIYGRHLTRLTTVLPGARESLAALSGAGLKLAVVSNKPMPFTRAVVDHYGFSPFLSVVQGAQPGIAEKPAPDMLFAALARMDVAAEHAFMVGDSAADARSAEAAGMAVVLVRGGHSLAAMDALGADHVLDANRLHDRGKLRREALLLPQQRLDEGLRLAVSTLAEVARPDQS